MNRQKRMDRLGAMLDEREWQSGGMDARSLKAAQMETAGLTDAEIDTLIAERTAMLDDIEAKIGNDDCQNMRAGT